jgi:hypothetical protein
MIRLHRCDKPPNHIRPRIGPVAASIAQDNDRRLVVDERIQPSSKSAKRLLP